MTPLMIEERARYNNFSRAQAALHNSIVAPVATRWYGEDVTGKDVPTPSMISLTSSFCPLSIPSPPKSRILERNWRIRSGRLDHFESFAAF